MNRVELYYKRNHIKMWDYIIYEIKKAYKQKSKIPLILKMKNDFLYYNNEILHLSNSCYACHFTTVENKSFNKVCSKCPLVGVGVCENEESLYSRLCKIITDSNCYRNNFVENKYLEAIYIAKKIRNSWR